MDRIRIRGRTPLTGVIPISGAKNAALPLMAACLLTDEPLVLSNLPRLMDISTMAKLLSELGVEINVSAEVAQAARCPTGRVIELTAHAIHDSVGALRPGAQDAGVGGGAGAAAGALRPRAGVAAGRLRHRHPAGGPASQGAGATGRRDRAARRLHRGARARRADRRPRRLSGRHRRRHREPVDGRHPRQGRDGARQRRPRAGGHRPRAVSRRHGSGDRRHRHRYADDPGPRAAAYGASHHPARSHRDRHLCRGRDDDRRRSGVARRAARPDRGDRRYAERGRRRGRRSPGRAAGGAAQRPAQGRRRDDRAVPRLSHRHAGADDGADDGGRTAPR